MCGAPSSNAPRTIQSPKRLRGWLQLKPRANLCFCQKPASAATLTNQRPQHLPNRCVFNKLCPPTAPLLFETRDSRLGSCCIPISRIHTTSTKVQDCAVCCTVLLHNPAGGRAKTRPIPNGGASRLDKTSHGGLFVERGVKIRRQRAS